jgi:hypothetical protein
MNRLRALADSLKQLHFLAESDFETYSSIEQALNRQGIRILSHDPLRLEWTLLDPAKPYDLSTPPPTLLVSPNSLGILEVVFSKTSAELSDYRSVFEFARENHLSQPKLSHFKTYFQATGLFDLRAKLAALPLETWIRAIDYPNTKKGLTPFFETARAYFPSIPESIAPGTIRNFFDAHELKEGRDWYPGPNDQGIPNLTLIRAESFWVNENAERKIKRHFKLVPAVFNPLESVIYLARPKKDFVKEAIISPAPDDRARPNRFRTVWDLLRGEARLREAGIDLLKRLLSS